MEVADNVTIFRDGNKVGDFSGRELNEKKLSYYMTGRNIEYSRYQRSTKDDGPVLEIKELTRKPNYEKISLTVRKGDIVGITGLLGSGRTELALTLFGLNPQDSGTMLLNGKEYRPASPTQAVEAGVSMLPEDRQTQGAYLEKSISDNICAAVLKKISGRMGILQRGKQEKIAQDALTRLNVKAVSYTHLKRDQRKKRL